MVELKVQCDCGQKLKFDVEPVGGRMPFTLNCPVCGADATGKANELLAQMYPVPAAPAPQPAPVIVAGVPSVPTGPAKLRINSPAHAPAAPVEVPADPSAPPAPRAPAVMGRPGARPAVAEGKPKRKPNFALGFVGAILGTLLGAAIYYGIFKATGFRMGIMGLGVGFLGGLGARLLGGEQEGNELGFITAALVIGGIVGAQYFVARAWWNEMGAVAPSSGYEARVAESKKVLAAIPNGTDQEIRVYLASLDSDADKPDPAAVTAEEVKEFREKNLPEFRNFAEGKISKQDYEKEHATELAKEQEERNSEEGTFKAVFMLLLVSRVGLISTVAAAGLAFKMSS